MPMGLSGNQLWIELLQRLQQQLSRPTFDTWIQPTILEAWQDNCLIIRTPNRFVLNHLQKHYIKAIATIAEEIMGSQVEIQLISTGGDNLTIVQETEEPSFLARASKPSKLNPKYTFYRFVVGPTNRMAHAASLAVAESPGRDFNPLFLCGKVGLGKTHLMQAIGHYRLEIDADSRIFYVSCEQFTNDLIAAIRQGQDSIQKFRQHYRQADILLIDDIQFLEGQEYTQEEFFHTFNSLYEAGRQVILACDRLPNQIPRLQERLISRFSMGLVADIQVPDLETRIAILQKKAEYDNIPLPRPVVEYIASKYNSNIRELEGALIRAMAYISISGLPMNVENIMPILNNAPEKVLVAPEVILNLITITFKVSLEALKSSSRRREISYARQVGMYLMRQHTELSLPRIGEEFGGKDHTTVMYSCEKISQLSKQDPEVNETIRQLSERINQSILGKS